MIDLTLEQMNWELCIAYLDDAIRELEDCQRKLREVGDNLEDIEL